MKKILLLASVIAMVSCSQDDTIFPEYTEHTETVSQQSVSVIKENADSIRMWNDIQKCEHSLDSIARVFPLSDTIGGTDPYMALFDAMEAFRTAKNDEERESAYKEYMQNYEIVIELYNELVNE